MKNTFEVRGLVTAIFLRRKDGTVIETVIDTVDLPIAQSIKNKWFACWCQKSKTFYVRGYRGEQLHRRIMECPQTLQVDHLDHDGLNNRRYNLINCTSTCNQLNRRGPAGHNRSSGVLGVHLAERGRWRARVRVNGRPIYLGRFEHKEDAVEVSQNFRMLLLSKLRPHGTVAH